MTDTNKRRRAVPIIAAALLLVVLVLLAGRGPRWHLVFVDVAGPAGAGPEATPRLAGLRDAGAWVEIPGALPDRATIDQLADDLALGPKAANGNRIHIDRTVNRGDPVGLVDGQGFGPADECANLGPQVFEIGKLIVDVVVRIAQQAETAVGNDFDLGGAALATDGKLAIA